MNRALATLAVSSLAVCLSHPAQAVSISAFGTNGTGPNGSGGDATAVAVSADALNVASAYGGYGFATGPVGGDGGNAFARAEGTSLSAPLIQLSSDARGGPGASQTAAATSGLFGGNGGDASASGRASGTGPGEIAMSVSGYGGGGGTGTQGATGGDGGVGTATAYGESLVGARVNVQASSLGGNGGNSLGSSPAGGTRAGNGGAASLVDAVDGRTTGDLLLFQTADSGSGGNSTPPSGGAGVGGNGGSAENRLTRSVSSASFYMLGATFAGVGGDASKGAGSIGGNGGDSTLNYTLSNSTGSLQLETRVYGGSGGSGYSLGGNGGSAESLSDVTAAGAISVLNAANAGRGGAGTGGTGSNTQAGVGGTAIATAVGRGTGLYNVDVRSTAKAYAGGSATARADALGHAPVSAYASADGSGAVIPTAARSHLAGEQHGTLTSLALAGSESLQADAQVGSGFGAFEAWGEARTGTSTPFGDAVPAHRTAAVGTLRPQQGEVLQALQASPTVANSLDATIPGEALMLGSLSVSNAGCTSSVGCSTVTSLTLDYDARSSLFAGPAGVTFGLGLLGSDILNIGTGELTFTISDGASVYVTQFASADLATAFFADHLLELTGLQGVMDLGSLSLSLQLTSKDPSARFAAGFVVAPIDTPEPTRAPLAAVALLALVLRRASLGRRSATLAALAPGWRNWQTRRP